MSIGNTITLIKAILTKENGMLFRTLKRAIESGKTEGIADKIDVFFALGKLTQEEYDTLMDMLKPEEE